MYSWPSASSIKNQKNAFKQFFTLKLSNFWLVFCFQFLIRIPVTMLKMSGIHLISKISNYECIKNVKFSAVSDGYCPKGNALTDTFDLLVICKNHDDCPTNHFCYQQRCCHAPGIEHIEKLKNLNGNQIETKFKRKFALNIIKMWRIALFRNGNFGTTAKPKNANNIWHAKNRTCP